MPSSAVKALRDSTVGLRGGAQITAPRTTYSLSAVVDRRDLRDRKWEERAGLEAALERRNATGGSVFAALSALSVNNRQTDDLDGSATFWQIGVRQGFGGRGIIGISAFGEVRNVEAGFEGYNSYGLLLFGQYNARFGLEISPELSWSRRDFTDSNPIFTGNPDEDRWEASLRIEKSDLFIAGGFSPFVEAEYERVDSGISAFSYTETAVRVGLNRQF